MGYCVRTQRLLAGGPPDRVAGPVDGRLPRGIDPAHRAGVGLGRDPDPRRRPSRPRTGPPAAGAPAGRRSRAGGRTRPARAGRAGPAGAPRGGPPRDSRPRPAAAPPARRRSEIVSPGRDPQAIVDQQVRPAGDQVFGHARACFPIGSRPGRGEMTSPRDSRYRSPPFPATHHPRAAGIRGVEPGRAGGGISRWQRLLGSYPLAETEMRYSGGRPLPERARIHQSSPN